MKINGQKVIINDISGKYPRRIETFHGMDENLQKSINDRQRRSNQNSQSNMSQREQEQDEEYAEAQRLLKFLDYFIPIDPHNVPLNSIIREFIGGGIILE